MPDSFPLTDSPWIPCALPDGGTELLSLRDVLLRAHTISGLVLGPLESAAVHRLLLAVLHRALNGPQSRTEWAEWVEAGAFDAEAIAAYCDRVADRMDLLHPTAPFMQTRGLADKFNVDPIDMLSMVRSRWGGARELFAHRSPEHVPTMSLPEAARALLVHQAFAVGGLVKKPGEPTSATAAPLVRAAVVLLRGPTLFLTLMKNLLVYRPDDDVPIAKGGGEDRPSWEQEPPPKDLTQAKEPKRHPYGWVDLLTWTSRRLELVCDGERVTGFVRAVGQGLDEPVPQDPMVTYRKHDKLGWLSLGIDPNKAFWQNANALFVAEAYDGRAFIRPKAFDLLASPEAEDVFEPTASTTLDVLGLSAEKSRLDLIRAEHLRCLTRLFRDPDAAHEVDQALANADAAIKALGQALWRFARDMLSPGDRDPDTKDVRALSDSWGAKPAAWNALGVHFQRFLLDLGELAPEVARTRFLRHCLEVVRDRFTHVTRGQETVRGLRAEAAARHKLNIGLKPLREQLPQEPTPDVNNTPPQEAVR